MWPVEAREGGQEVGEGGLGVGQTADSRNQVGGKGGEAHVAHERPMWQVVAHERPVEASRGP